jgi:tyrosine-protein kinase Etk/Wzc
VITPAGIVSRSPVSSLVISTLAGLIAGLALAIAIVVVRARAENRVHDVDDVTVAGVPLLGSVSLREVMDTTHNLATPGHARAPIGRGLRELRVALLSRERRRPVRILVAPAAGEKGQAHSALGLAHAMAMSNIATVLVDIAEGPASSRITEALRLKDKPGFTDVLMHGADLERTLRRVDDNLQVLPSGTADPHMQDLLSSPRMPTLLDHLEKVADIVILATGAITGADAQAIAMVADCVLIEAVEGQTRVRDLVAVANNPRSEMVTGVIYVTGSKADLKRPKREAPVPAAAQT